MAALSILLLTSVTISLVAPGDAHAQSGWILMIAPFVEDPEYTRRVRALESFSPDERPRHRAQTLLNQKAPLSEWSQFKAFDTAQACETERTGFDLLPIDAWKKETWNQDDVLRISGNTRIANGRCVPASVIFGTPRTR
jgi:hypothetical protein